MTLCHGDVSRSTVSHIQAFERQSISSMLSPSIHQQIGDAALDGEPQDENNLDPRSRKRNCIRIYVHKNSLLLC